jgi:hypothetical protein
MKLFHAIFCYGPHNHLLDSQCKTVDDVIGFPPVRRVVYYGQGTEVVRCGLETHVVGARESYENLPLKTYGLILHALTDPNWDVLLKTDVNSMLGYFNAELVESHDLVGYCGHRKDTRSIALGYHTDRVSEPLLREHWKGPEPSSWIGGPAYTMSRRLASFVISKGVWWARSWPYEDIMVSCAADELGSPAVGGIGYYSDADNFCELHRNK